MKLARGVRAKWLSFDKESWTLIGKDMDSLSTSLNPDVEQNKNILGDTYVDHKGFTPESDIEYKARTEDAIYEKLQKIVDELLKDEESTTAYMIDATLTDEVKNSDNTTLTGTGYQVPVIVVPQEDGGDTAGYAINFNCYENGNRVQGTVSVTNRVPTFTENPAPTDSTADNTTA